MTSLQALIKRPILAMAINLLILLLGSVAYSQLEMRQEPHQQISQLQVWTYYPGAHAAAVELQITQPLEDALAGLDGLLKMSSHSKDFESVINLTFRPDYPINEALSQTRDRVYESQTLLPDEVNRSSIYEMAHDHYLAHLSVRDDSLSPAALSDWIKRSLVPDLRLLEGVALIEEQGLSRYIVQVSLDPILLHQRSLTIGAVLQALKNDKSFASGGEIRKGSKRQAIVLNAPHESIEDLKEITVNNQKGQLVALREVSHIEILPEPSRRKASLDGAPLQLLSIKPKPSANPFEVMKRVRRLVQTVQLSLPAGRSFEVMHDNTAPFQAAIDSVYRALIEAIVLVAIVIRLSLGSLRAALIPLITVPLCLIGTLALLLYLGFSINPISLLALVLSIGLVVDDAIVIVENVFHQFEQGIHSAVQACTQSLSDIGFSIVSMTLTLSAVYLPLAFQTESSASFMREFAWTLSGSVLLSGFVALTLTPTLCAISLRPKVPSLESQARRSEWYVRGLKYFLAHSKLSAAIFGLIVVTCVTLFNALPAEYMPTEDNNVIQGQVSVQNDVPQYLRDQWQQAIARCANSIPEHTHLFQLQSEQGMYWQLLLKPRQARSRDAFKIQKKLQACFETIPGPLISSRAGSSRASQNEDSLKIIITHTGRLEDLSAATQLIYQRLLAANLDFIDEIDNVQNQTIPRLHVNVNRELTAQLGIGLKTVEEVVRTQLSGSQTGLYYFQDRDYPIELKAHSAYQQGRLQLDDFYVTTPQQHSIPIGSLVRIEEKYGVHSIRHDNRVRSQSLNVHLKANTNFEALDPLIELIQQSLSPGMQFRFGGNYESFEAAKAQTIKLFALSAMVIYLLLAALFESLILPWVVLITVPLSLVGALLLVKSMHGSNNVFTQIGLMTLIGLITKHGILITDSARNHQLRGLDAGQAVIQAAVTRLRPILMTSAVMILGAVPLLFARGAYGFAQQHLAWVIIGGMATGTLLSLIFVPCGYVWLSRLRALGVWH